MALWDSSSTHQHWAEMGYFLPFCSFSCKKFPKTLQNKTKKPPDQTKQNKKQQQTNKKPQNNHYTNFSSHYSSSLTCYIFEMKTENSTWFLPSLLSLETPLCRFKDKPICLHYKVHLYYYLLCATAVLPQVGAIMAYSNCLAWPKTFKTTTAPFFLKHFAYTP